MISLIGKDSANKPAEGFTPLEKPSNKIAIKNKLFKDYDLELAFKHNVRLTSLTGFTLTELIMVVGIVLVFLTFAAPAFRNAYQDGLIKNATRELAHSLAYARDLAIIEGVNYEASFDVDENKYTVAPIYDFKSFQNKQINVTKTSYSNYLPDKISFTRLRKYKITFYPNGSSEDFFIYLQDAKNNIYTIAIKGVYSQIKTFNFYYYE